MIETVVSHFRLRESGQFVFFSSLTVGQNAGVHVFCNHWRSVSRPREEIKQGRPLSRTSGSSARCWLSALARETRGCETFRKAAMVSWPSWAIAWNCGSEKINRANCNFSMSNWNQGTQIRSWARSRRTDGKISSIEILREESENLGASSHAEMNSTWR
jgi:hypothetical protein